MKMIEKKTVNKKINWLVANLLVLTAMITFTNNITHVNIFDWFDDIKSQTEFLSSSLYRLYPKRYNRDLLSQLEIWLGWAVVKGMFTMTDSI